MIEQVGGVDCDLKLKKTICYCAGSDVEIER